MMDIERIDWWTEPFWVKWEIPHNNGTTYTYHRLVTKEWIEWCQNANYFREEQEQKLFYGKDRDTAKEL